MPGEVALGGVKITAPGEAVLEAAPDPGELTCSQLPLPGVIGRLGSCGGVFSVVLGTHTPSTLVVPFGGMPRRMCKKNVSRKVLAPAPLEPGQLMSEAFRVELR